MDLDTFIIAVFCWIDEALPQITTGRRLRERGPAPVLDDCEVLTMEVVGAYLGLGQETALFAYFRRHWSHYFPALRQVHRTTWTRQAAHLRQVKERLWQRAVAQVPHDPDFALVDSLPLPVCQFARAYRCRRFRGEARYGKDTLVRQTFYGFRLHVRLAWPGIITQFSVVPANIHELAVVPQLTAQTTGWLIGDRNYGSPLLRQQVAATGLALLAPYRSAKRDPQPQWSAPLSRVRYRIATVFGQLVERTQIKRVWARDTWHRGGRLLRLVLMHTLAVLFNLALGHEPLHLASLVV